MSTKENSRSATSKSKPEVKGKSWRREREERNRRLQLASGNADSVNSLEIMTKSIEVEDEVPEKSDQSSSYSKNNADNVKDLEENLNQNELEELPKEESMDKAQDSNSEKNESIPKEESEPVENNQDENEEVLGHSEEISEEVLEKQRLEEKRQAELEYIQEYIFENTERIKSKLELRHQNQLKSANRPEEEFFTKLDSSLKKNTAFIKRLKNMTEAQKESMIKDFHSLNLTKYVSEAATAIVETKLKLSDVNCAVTLCSLLHQRYAEFKPLLLENWHKVLPLKREEKISNPSKVRVDLRFFAELISCGVFAQKEGLPILGNLLTVLTANDKDEHKNANIILSFCKHCGEDYAGLISRNIRILTEVHKIELPTKSLLPAERQKGLRNLLKEYYRSLCRHLVNDHKALQNLRRLNNRILCTKGELNIERKEKFEAVVEAYQKLLVTTQSFSDLFDENMPELPVDKNADEEDENSIDLFSRFKESESEGDTFSLWEDEETRTFYESLQNLKAFIPGILFKDSIKNNKQTSDGEDTAIPELEEDMSKLDLVDDMMTMVDNLEKTAEDVSKDDDEESSTQTEKQSSVEADIVNALIPDIDGSYSLFHIKNFKFHIISLYLSIRENLCMSIWIL
ncbi:Regulator of nonsense transcripts 2 [Nymphon striatum]|nr:Regulator of nonsense transcripts 2 [Nymphon striatum]